MTKQFTITSNGKEIKMLFGTNGFFFHVKDAAEMDPFEWLKKFQANTDLMREGQGTAYAYIEDVRVIMYAGINTYADVNDIEPVSFDKVKRMASGLSFDDCTNIFNTAFLAFLKPGEAEAPGLNGAKVLENHGMTSEQKPTD